MLTEIKLETDGSVWKIFKEPGDKVIAGETLFILEVMKMEVTYEAPISGKLTAVYIKEGEVVEEGQTAAEILGLG